jgi:competence protein ComEA
MGWFMGTLATTAALAAAGVGVAGLRTTPSAGKRPAALLAPTRNPDENDPLSPRFLDPSSPIRVHVAGAVRKPGVYSLPAWARVTDAVKKAGGPREDADLDSINMADHLRDAEQIRVPIRGRPEPMSAHAPAREPVSIPATVGGEGMGRFPFASRTASAGAGGSVNLNTATAKDLEALPGIGPKTAERILAYRKEAGPFVRAEDLMNVKGIGEAKFARLRSLVTAP